MWCGLMITQNRTQQVLHLIAEKGPIKGSELHRLLPDILLPTIHGITSSLRRRGEIKPASDIRPAQFIRAKKAFAIKKAKRQGVNRLRKKERDWIAQLKGSIVDLRAASFVSKEAELRAARTIKKLKSQIDETLTV